MKNIFLCCALLFSFCSSNALGQTATPPSSGDGSSGEPYQIANLNNLYWVTQNSTLWSKDFIQTADIDASSSSTWIGDTGFSPIGNEVTEFSGSYDGQNHTISGLYIHSSWYGKGMFGFAQGGTIKNIGLVDVNITANSYAGGLVGFNQSNISNCFSTGSVSGTAAWDGGLVGLNDGDISKSYSAASVSGSAWVGGLAGASYTNIDNCYSIGSVQGGGAGGLIGKLLLSLTITNCYSTGPVSGFELGGLVGDAGGNSVTISNSFWDNQTSGQSSSAGGGTGYATAVMKTGSTYTDAGWDFTTIWTIDAGVNHGYPTLQGVIALPVELVSFTAASNQMSTELQW